MIRKSLLFSLIGVLSIVGVAAAVPIVPASDCLQSYSDSKGWDLDAVEDQMVMPIGWGLSEGSTGTHATSYRETPAESVKPVPEPASMLLLGSGLLGLAVIGRGLGRRKGKGHSGRTDPD